MSETTGCPFCDILEGKAPGTIIARDDEKRMALIKNIHPESAVHWLAVPYEHKESTEKLQAMEGTRFLELVEFALESTKAAVEDEPLLEKGFSMKIHFGSFETIAHPKLHILAME
jgi:histidine triad (HIT) family protein